MSNMETFHEKLYPTNPSPMQVIIDKNNLLGIQDTNLETGKIYQHNFQGYQISDKNKLLFVVHKKEIKLIELKNIGSTMGVLYCNQRNPIHKTNLKKENILLASQLFEGFDEETGEKYHFFPNIASQRVEQINTIFTQLSLPLHLQKTQKGVIIPQKKKVQHTENESLEEILSYFFGLTILYGKFESKE